MTTARFATPLTALLLLAACSDDGDELSTVELEGADVEGETSTDDSEDDGESTGREGQANEGADGATELVDLTEAVAGTWPVGDAGTVTFAIAEGALVLEDVAAADGWRAEVDEQDADAIEVDFTRGSVEWEIEIELEDGGTTLEIEIDQEIEPAEPGSYDIGDAGQFTFDVADGALALTDLTVEDAWTVTERDEEADEIELELARGPREYDVGIELDGDGTTKVEIDYEVVGPVAD